MAISKNGLFAFINEKYDDMTPAQKKIADFILENPRETVHLTITDLAQQCESATLTQTVYKGSGETYPGIDEKVVRGDSADIIRKKLLSSNLSVLNETYELLKIEDIENAVNLLLKARKICFFRVGSSAIIAMEANDRFMRTTDKTDFTFDSHFQ